MKRQSKLQEACFNAAASNAYRNTAIYKASVGYVMQRCGYSNEQQALEYALRVDKGGKK